MSAPIPFALPALCAGISAGTAGLTAFGDAILFHILWAIAGAFGLVPPGRETLAKAVTYITVMSWANFLIMLYLARKDLRRVFGYAVANACTGVPMVVVGASLLFSADLFALKLFVGLFFLVFSVVKLSAAAFGIARRRLAREAEAEAARRGGAAAANGSPAASGPAPGETETVAGGGAASDDWAAVVAKPDAPRPEPAGAGAVHIPPSHSPSSTFNAAASDGTDLRVAASPRPSSSPSSWLSSQLAKLPPISAIYSVRTTLLAFVVSGAFAGLLNGLLGTGGPPQMVVFSILEVDKETIRSMSAVYGAFLLPVRIYMFTQAKGNVFNPDDWPIYLSVAVASWAGFIGGTLLRRKADTDAIIRVLLVLVFASSAILLGALEDASLAAAYIVGGLVWGVALVALILRPERCPPGVLAGWDAAAKCTCLRGGRPAAR